jgi:hypothetical protein
MSEDPVAGIVTPGVTSPGRRELGTQGLMHHHQTHPPAKDPLRSHGCHWRMTLHQLQPPPLERAHTL